MTSSPHLNSIDFILRKKIPLFQSAEQWQYVFYIASTIYLLGALFYGLFASGERQPWAMDDHTPTPQSEKEENHAYVNKAMSDEHV